MTRVAASRNCAYPKRHISQLQGPEPLQGITNIWHLPDIEHLARLAYASASSAHFGRTFSAASGSWHVWVSDIHTYALPRWALEQPRLRDTWFLGRGREGRVGL